jgi:hypothetical protein
MWRKRKENFRDEWIAWVVIIALVIYAIITTILWLSIIWIIGLIVFIAYELSSHIEETWINILVWIISITLIAVWTTEILKNYWKINKSIVDYSFDTAQDLKLKTSKKWNIKIESDYWTLIETNN